MLTTSFLDDLQGGMLHSLEVFLPELVLCGGIVVLLLLRLFLNGERLHLGFVALGFTLAALGFAWVQWQSHPSLQGIVQQQDVFGGMIVFDRLTAFMRLFLLAFTSLTILLCLLTGIPDREDSGDFSVLLMGACIGMMLMTSANHLLMVYIAVEMASLPCYGLAGFLKGRRQSSEAALKYVVYGGAASGVMLYGISLLAGRFGTAYLPDVASSFLTVFQNAIHAGRGTFDPVLLMGMLLILVGLAFKLSAVPFHFWCPDVFEGAAAEVAAFLSVASKGAAVALVGRLSLAFVGATGSDGAWSMEQWRSVAAYLGPVIAAFAAITATFGNLAAYSQTNLKRLLAYSTIAHAGYMMMALATLTPEGLDAALLYLVVYLFTNLGAFAVVAFLRNQTGSEDLSAYRGMIYRAPGLTLAMAVFLLSLVGLPPLFGYVGKFQIFAALWHAYVEFKNQGLLVLLIIGLLNTVISLVYYVRVLKVMIIEQPSEEQVERRLVMPPLQSAFALILAVAVVGGILFWDPLANSSRQAVSQFRTVESSRPVVASTTAMAR